MDGQPRYLRDMPPFLLFALLGAQVAPGPLPDRPVPLTLAALWAQPARYEGQWVRLAGQIDRCSGLQCNICPREATLPVARGCAGIDWDRQGGVPSDKGFRFGPAYRYADVEVVAQFNGACWRPTVVCTDNASTLLHARAVRVLKRRPSALGLGHGAPRDRLVDAPAAVQASLSAIMKHGMPDLVYGEAYRVYAYPADPLAAQDALVCRSSGADDAAKWPVDSATALAPGSEDRYRCFWADHKGGTWFIHPDALE